MDLSIESARALQLLLALESENGSADEAIKGLVRYYSRRNSNKLALRVLRFFDLPDGAVVVYHWLSALSKFPFDVKVVDHAENTRALHDVISQALVLIDVGGIIPLRILYAERDKRPILAIDNPNLEWVSLWENQYYREEDHGPRAVHRLLERSFGRCGRR